MNLLISPIRFENLHRSIPKLAAPRKSTVSKTDNPFPPRQWIACWICNEVKIPLLAIPERGAEKLRVENRGRKKRRRRRTISISLLFDYQMVDSFQRGIGQPRRGELSQGYILLARSWHEADFRSTLLSLFPLNAPHPRPFCAIRIDV